MWRRIALFCLGFLALAVTVESVYAQRYERRWHHDQARWKLLGTQAVGFGVDKDVIRVGADDGAFKSLVLVVRKNDIFLHRMTVVFGNGDRQDMRIDDTLRDGERTRSLDLEGRQRVIDRIELVYKSRPNFKGQAVIEVYGEQGHRRGVGAEHGPGRRGQWVDLGCQKVGFLGDRDTINLPARDDRYRAIRILARGASLDLRRVRVHFRNGDSTDIARPQHVRAGESSDRLDLPGDKPRHVVRIDMNYASKLSIRGEATACVQGQE